MRPVANRSAAAAALALGLALALPGGAEAIQVGDLAPDFTLTDVDGTPHQLAALRGNLVLLAFVGWG
jgi:cytochrome oxidase Cu insertion factor (SCO1/SenC/PrrC family)